LISLLLLPDRERSVLAPPAYLPSFLREAERNEERERKGRTHPDLVEQDGVLCCIYGGDFPDLTEVLVDFLRLYPFRVCGDGSSWDDPDLVLWTEVDEDRTTVVLDERELGLVESFVAYWRSRNSLRAENETRGQLR